MKRNRRIARRNPSKKAIGVAVAVAGVACLLLIGGALVLSGGGPASTIAIAKSYVGAYETSTNRGPVVDLFNEGTGQAWCGWFVSFVLGKAGVSALHNRATLASVSALHDKAASLGVLRNTPSVGAVFLHMTGMGITGRGYDHTGFVAEMLPDGTWRSVEGNASDCVKEEPHPRPGEEFLFIPFSALSRVFA